MTRFLVFLLIVGATLYFLSWLGRRHPLPPKEETFSANKPSRWFRPKAHPREPWVQVYETESMDEGRALQAQLQEQEVECILYEQGKKDIHGNAPKGVGVAVPKTAMTLAQKVISRLLS